jgi:hypothetical protein
MRHKIIEQLHVIILWLKYKMRMTLDINIMTTTTGETLLYLYSHDF